MASKKETFKRLINIDNSYLIFNVNWSTVGSCWHVTEMRNNEKILLPVAVTLSRICDFPVYRLLFFKLMFELALKVPEAVADNNTDTKDE